MRPDKLYVYSGVHLHYEVSMCAEMARLLVTSPPPVPAVSNALVESYALHVRNVIEFLYLKKQYDDDLRASHFVTSPAAWAAARGTMPPGLAETKARADKQVAHFTKKRFADGATEKVWRPGVEIPMLVAGLRLFLQHADPKKIHPNVQGAVGRLAALVEGKADAPTR